MRVHRRRQRRLGHAATKHRACMQRGMQSVCNQYAISMQSVCNQYAISAPAVDHARLQCTHLHVPSTGPAAAAAAAHVS